MAHGADELNLQLSTVTLTSLLLPVADRLVSPSSHHTYLHYVASLSLFVIVWSINILTPLAVSTVTQVTNWRLCQLVHVITVTVLDLDIVTPSTAFVAPVVANFSSHSTLSKCGI